MQKAKKSAPVKPVRTPFLTGSPTDHNTAKSALMIFGALIAVAFVNLLLGTMLMFGSRALSIGANGLLLALVYLLFASSGTSNGAIAVNQGEIMYRRKETGREIKPGELRQCFHPLKGFLIGLLGTIPLLVCAIVLAIITKRQMATPGALPSWVTGMVGAPEVTAALPVYTTATPLGLEGILRIVVRLALMPFVNMLGAENADSMLLLERLSPLLVLLPGIFYGIGYLRGVQVRTQVHTDIAEGRKKQAKRAKKQKARAQARQPQQLN